MRTDEFRNLCAARPFRPFRVHLADGRSIPVRHQEFAMLAPNGRTAVVYQPDSTFEIIDLLLVTSLAVNGRKSARSH
jgi:hypothetical protein